MFRIRLLHLQWFCIVVLSPSVSVAADPKPGEVAEIEIAPDVKVKLCWIPGGQTQLGSPRAERLVVLKQLRTEREPDWLEGESEGVRGMFKTNGFWLGKFEVTQKEWRSVMNNNPSQFVKGHDEIDKAGIRDTSRFPVDGVCWNDCQEFLKQVNVSAKVPAIFGKGKFALPHENEWEYACRGGMGNGRAFSFGTALDGTRANVDGQRPFGINAEGPVRNRITEVGTYEMISPHPWALCDIHGNVWEWCASESAKDSGRRIMRGGAWSSAGWLCRSAHRNAVAPGVRYRFGFGLRICFKAD